jgi:hypothetical protein
MIKKGVKTAAEYHAEGVRVPGLREPAPKDLEPAAVVFWESIIIRLPVDWFTSETVPLLKAYCRHSAYADQFAHDIAMQREMVRALETGVQNRNTAKQLVKASGHLISLHHMHGYETERAASIATKLRLTIQAKYIPEKAASRARASVPSGAPPWHDWNTHVSPEANA